MGDHTGEYLSACARAALIVAKTIEPGDFDEFDYIESTLLELLTAYIDEAKPVAERIARTGK